MCILYFAYLLEFVFVFYFLCWHQANARENGEFDFVEAAAEAEAEAESRKGAAAAYFTTQSPASKVSEESVDNDHHGGLPGQTPAADGDVSEAALGERIYGFGAQERKTKVQWPV